MAIESAIEIVGEKHMRLIHGIHECFSTYVVCPRCGAIPQNYCRDGDSYADIHMERAEAMKAALVGWLKGEK